jgi:hypothetical protein
MATCPECGTDTYQARNWTRWYDRYLRLQDEYERQAAEHAVEAAKWRLKEFDREEDRKGLQRKVREQSGVIAKLEDRLRALGTQPYAQSPDDGAGEPPLVKKS